MLHHSTFFISLIYGQNLVTKLVDTKFDMCIKSVKNMQFNS